VESWTRDNSRKFNGSSDVVLAKKGSLRPMRFLKRFGILLAFTLTLGLFCSEVPESLGLYDDTSNDFVASTPAHQYESVRTTRRAANPQLDAAPIATFPSAVLICFSEPALPSGPELLRLLSIQRK
jgi:hypothetical protein